MKKKADGKDKAKNATDNAASEANSMKLSVVNYLNDRHLNEAVTTGVMSVSVSMLIIILVYYHLSFTNHLLITY